MQRGNFDAAMAAVARLRIDAHLTPDQVLVERPCWKDIMSFVIAIYAFVYQANNT